MSQVELKISIQVFEFLSEFEKLGKILNFVEKISSI